MFPAGAPGFALLVLRNCIAFALAHCAFPTGWPHFVFLGLLSTLCIGLMTPAGCLAAVISVIGWAVYFGEFQDANVIVVALSTLSLALLGPGAFSIDARLFGRRMLVSTSAGVSRKGSA
jgi:hypothetical protein